MQEHLKTHQRIQLHYVCSHYLNDTAKQEEFLLYSPTTLATGAAHLICSHFNGLLLDDPGD